MLWWDENDQTLASLVWAWFCQGVFCADATECYRYLSGCFRYLSGCYRCYGLYGSACRLGQSLWLEKLRLKDVAAESKVSAAREPAALVLMCCQQEVERRCECENNLGRSTQPHKLWMIVLYEMNYYF